jgi:hypothetical protein
LIIVLLVVTFMIAALTCFVLARAFRKPIQRILQRLMAEEIYTAWSSYLTFALYVVGISGGVRVWDLERYITPQGQDKTVLELTSDRWVLEVYRTVLGTMQSVAWMLLVFFLVALIAFVIVKGRDLKRAGKEE